MSKSVLPLHAKLHLLLIQMLLSHLFCGLLVQAKSKSATKRQRIANSTAGGHELEMLFIARAKCERDRWSGNIAFPGECCMILHLFIFFSGGKLERGERSYIYSFVVHVRSVRSRLPCARCTKKLVWNYLQRSAWASWTMCRCTAATGPCPAS